MVATPHPDSAVAINCAIMTVSDTRTVETDRSGQLIRQLLHDAGHEVAAYVILKDEPVQIQTELEQLSQRTDVAAVIINGGTGIAPRDTTYDAIAALLEKTLPGFGELFRWLSYQDIGSRAMASRAIAGVFRAKLVFSIPGSTGAVTLAMQTLILPELRHLVGQIHTNNQ
ncbi:MogA/MoaB family molybdenum cofactor biosynthesis protein [Leptolyngbya sp. FACHB-321]|uniref:MogA/MoaB family molybdenum cofactor biosynthesis protein n=1 Tax=Leptolyngbya sp. FACHB-321 TaxID=2692807 RepID=UPI0016872354|nr:MogA/MoaB family molybdenum cofactor biosynthesis protein [Leptolyngbya sp. FACHB-321]MBD2036773.1 MogA/MoaB family molybdenum cofactor biosynthesis protein [Leptolyngbya sp. FACHB-321]